MLPFSLAKTDEVMFSGDPLSKVKVETESSLVHAHTRTHFMLFTKTHRQKERENSFFFSGAKNIIRKYFSAMCCFRFPLDSRAPLSLTQKIHIYHNPNRFLSSRLMFCSRKLELPKRPVTL